MGERGFAVAATLGVVLAVVLTVFVFATGQTFSQRCAAIYDTPSAEWERCVDRLSKGGPAYEENVGRMTND